MTEEEIKTAQTEVKTLWVEMKKALEKEAAEREKEGTARAETKTTVDKLNEKITDLETKISRPAAEAEGKNKDEISMEMKVYHKFLRKQDLTPEETKALTTADDVSGGYLAPNEVSKDIIAQITEISPLRSICDVQKIGAKALEIVKDSTGLFTSYWDDETEVEQVATFGKETIPAQNLHKTVLVTPEMIEDSVINIDSYVRKKVVEAFASKEGTAFVTGNGVKRPEGFLTKADILSGYIPSLDASVVTSDALINLSFALKEGYLKNARFVLNRNSLKAVRLLTKALGGTANAADYVWQPGFGTVPSTLLGHPYLLVADMPDITAGTYPIAFGDFKTGYKIVDRLATSIQRLIEKYAPNTGYMVRRRVGGQVIMAEAIKVMKIAAS